MDANKLESLISGYGINADDASWLRSLAPPAASDVHSAWYEGYRAGVLDERTSEASIGIAGFGAKIEPARVNPYAAPPAALAVPAEKPVPEPHTVDEDCNCEQVGEARGWNECRAAVLAAALAERKGGE